MAHLFGVFRLGRDAEKVTNENGTFLSLSLAYDIYANGETKTQWLRATLGGQRAEKVADLLVSGARISGVIKDVRVTTFVSKEGETKASLEGRLTDFDLISKPKQDE